MSKEERFFLEAKMPLHRQYEALRAYFVEELPSAEAAKKFGFSKQRYFQLRTAFLARGATALLSQKRGPKTNYRRTAEVVRQVIRHRFLDPEASAEVIAQKLCQNGRTISIRSVQRVIEDFGLQKKTLPLSSEG